MLFIKHVQLGFANAEGKVISCDKMYNNMLCGHILLPTQHAGC